MAGFKQATKAAAKLRLGLIGPAGSGKTMTALRIASGLGGRIAVIDTERGSASLYAGERGLAFDVQELDTYEVERFIQAIRDAAEAGYSTVVIDSLSHAWAGKGGILEYVDNAGKRNQGGGNFGAWRDATPRHNALVDAILGAPMHVICTLRSKVEYVVENVGGRNQVRKVGLQPVQRDGLEYEFTVVGDVTQDHDLVVTKTRAAWLKDAVIREAGEDLGKKLAAWLSEGTAGPVEAIRRPPATVEPESAQAPPPDPKAGSSDRLVARAVIAIGKAATVFECDELRERIDARLVAGEISNAEAEALLVELDAKESAIRVKEAADAVA
ncbi:MAG: ATP-binding protein [Planctomycetia bacterium]|nr:ATP-binding protein [Planctomycetia bacterium]